MGFIKEFKEFAVKGNVMDMAVGVIIGGAFGKIVTSLVNDVLMPLIGKLTGGVSFVDLFVNLGDGNYSTLAAAKEAGAAVFAYGQFIQNILQILNQIASFPWFNLFLFYHSVQLAADLVDHLFQLAGIRFVHSGIVLIAELEHRKRNQ